MTTDTATSGKDSRRNLASKLNWLRAGVLGANDGILSTAGIVVGVSGAAVGSRALLAAGLAGMIAGALSMAAGEYVSVSTQRDTEKARLAQQRDLLRANPATELAALAASIREQGVDASLASQVAEQLTASDALAAHARFRLGVDPEGLTNPWHAAAASFVSFLLGAVIPLAAIVLSPASVAVPLTVAAVTLSLAMTGSVSARLGEAPVFRATLRNVAGGLLAMGVTYWIGVAFANFA